MPCILLFHLGTPVNRGFFCEDNELKYPYVGDTVSVVAVMGATLITPLITVSTVTGYLEYLLFKQKCVCLFITFNVAQSFVCFSCFLTSLLFYLPFIVTYTSLFFLSDFCVIPSHRLSLQKLLAWSRVLSRIAASCERSGPTGLTSMASSSYRSSYRF